MMLSRTDLDAPLAEHFGKAKWLVVVEASGDRCEFVRNTGLNGRHVAETFAARGCTDVVVGHVGPGAYAHLAAAGIRVWHGGAGETARALARALVAGALRPVGPGEVDASHAPLHRLGGVR